MPSFDEELKRRLATIREQNLFRELRRVDSPQSTRIQFGGGAFLNFSSNDYLGLANHPALKEASIQAIEKFGAGSGASRLISGSLAPFHELEDALASFKRTQAALTFSTGYATAVGAICSLLGKDDVIILDKLIHASIVDAARLSGAKIRVFRHNDLNDLESILKWAREKAGPLSGGGGQSSSVPRQILIVTESIFSMDGDSAPLRGIAALKAQYGGWLMVDEAHATGIYGQNGRGMAEETGVADQVDIQMGTLGKALGASGGYICGSRALIDLLVNRARSFIFSTAPVPAAAAAARAGLKIVESAEGESRREALRLRAGEFNSQVERPGRAIASGAIQPVILGDETKTLDAAAELRAGKIFVPAIRYPAVARSSARLRVTLTAAHAADDILRLTAALNKIIHGKL